MTPENKDSFPLPLVQVPTEDVLKKAFASTGGKPTPFTPLGTAYLWWTALRDVDHYQTALRTLSLAPADWGDYKEAAALLADRAIMTFVVENPEDPAIRYVKFMEMAWEGSAQAIDDAEVDELFILTVVKPDESDYWLVWGLSHNHVPPQSEIRTH